MLSVERWLETDDAGLAGLVLRASHLSTASARPGLDGGWIAFFRASHLSTASARLALGGEMGRTRTHGGVVLGAAPASCSWAGSGAAPGEQRVPWRGARAQPASF
ncbi:hypothetical protein SEVIR_7G311750v4 [Setaria viridis]